MTVVEDQAENIRMLPAPEPKRIFLWRGAAKQTPRIPCAVFQTTADK